MATVTTATSAEVHSLTEDRTVIDGTLYSQVVDFLTVTPETQQGMALAATVPEFSLDGELDQNYSQLCEQMISLRDHQERIALTATNPSYWPFTATQGCQGEGLYCLRTALPTEEGKCNLWSLKLARARRTTSHWQEVTASTALFPGINRPHWTYSMTEFQLFQTDATMVTLAELPSLQMHGLPVSTGQHMATVLIALPRSRAYATLSTGIIDHEYFTHCQLNGWYCARSALLRLLQMHLDGGITVTETELAEPLTLIAWNPELQRLSGRTVHGVTGDEITEGGLKRMLCFNRLWIDHCLSTLALEEPLQLSPSEMNTGVGLNLGFTLHQLSQMQTEFQSAHQFGMHCRNFLGHLVLPNAILRKMGTGNTGNAQDTADVTMEDATADEVNVTIGNVPMDHCLSITVSKKK